MFTGIVEELGQVRELESGILSIQAGWVLSELAVKDSISVNGACLTVTDLDNSGFKVNVVPETIRRTNLGKLSTGDPVNLELSARLGGRLGGHIVQGHVDGTGEITGLVEDGEAHVFTFTASKSLLRYIVEKGFISVDGVSLTVVDCCEDSFSVTLIPYTIKHTVLGSKSIGDTVNLEVDIIAKYVEKLSKGEGDLGIS